VNEAGSLHPPTPPPIKHGSVPKQPHVGDAPHAPGTSTQVGSGMQIVWQPGCPVAGQVVSSDPGGHAPPSGTGSHNGAGPQRHVCTHS